MAWWCVFVPFLCTSVSTVPTQKISPPEDRNLHSAAATHDFECLIRTDGVPVCSTEKVKTQVSNHRNILGPSAIKNLAEQLYTLRPAKSPSDLRCVVPIALASWSTFNDSCVHSSSSHMQTLGACAELGLQLVSWSRDARLFDDAIKAAKRALAMSKAAALAETDSWRHGEKFAAVRMRSKAALARAYADNFQYDMAVETIEEILASMSADTPPAAVSILIELHSEIMTCKGDDKSALLVFERAVQLSKMRNLQQSRSFGVRHVELLNRVLASTWHHSFYSSTPYTAKADTQQPPTSVVESIRGKRDKVASELVKFGRWHRPDQFPQRMLPSLEDLGPYPSWDFMPKIFAEKVRDTLNRQTDVLEQEAWSLYSAGLMERDRECLASPNVKSLPKNIGRWFRFSPTGFWHDGGLDENGCASQIAPKACSTRSEIQNIIREEKEKTEAFHLHLVRVGYSVVEGRTWIRPHFGTTNAQFKMHLGLTVPEGNASESGEKFCPPAIRVGRLPNGKGIRSWSRGQVMLFDDSFEHEVKNECDSARIVFQVVFSRIPVNHQSNKKDVEL